VVAFYSDRDGNPEIYRMNLDGSGLKRLTDDPAFDDSPALSPDGKQIAFLSARNDPNPIATPVCCAARASIRLICADFSLPPVKDEIRIGADKIFENIFTFVLTSSRFNSGRA
jgi:tricorn protease-like protein